MSRRVREAAVPPVVQLPSAVLGPANSGAVYPAAWILEVPSIGLALEIEPYMANQEMNVSYSYWEGAVGVHGTFRDEVLSGSGYVELTGYSASMENEF